MAFTEKFKRATEARHWLGDMEPDHFHYTAGVAGERFFAALKDRGTIVGARCPRCEITYVPPRIYCELCFAELAEGEIVEVGTRGRVRSFTVARLDKASSPLSRPEIFALVGFGPGTTALLHRLGEAEPEQVGIGLQVEAVLKPQAEREGRITDIRYFRPATP